MTVTTRPPLYPELDYLGSAFNFADDVYEVISGAPLFDEFSHAEIEVLCQFMHCFAAPRGTVILREGESGDYLLVMLSGKVVVKKRDSSGQEESIAVVGPGDMLGEMSLFDGQIRFATCTTVEPTDFAVMARADLNEILLAHPRMANKFLIKMIQIEVTRMRDMGYRVIDKLPGPVV